MRLGCKAAPQKTSPVFLRDRFLRPAHWSLHQLFVCLLVAGVDQLHLAPDTQNNAWESTQTAIQVSQAVRITEAFALVFFPAVLPTIADVLRPYRKSQIIWFLSPVLKEMPLGDAPTYAWLSMFHAFSPRAAFLASSSSSGAMASLKVAAGNWYPSSVKNARISAGVSS